jgi:hypothetical protein
MAGSIICGVDDSEAAKGAARVARELAGELGLGLADPDDAGGIARFSLGAGSTGFAGGIARFGLGSGGRQG